MLSTIRFTGQIAYLIVYVPFFHLSRWASSVLHRLTYKQTAGPQNVLVVGASFAGYATAFNLANSLPTGYRVVIVEPKSHLQVPWFFPRFSVIGGHETKAFVPYGPYLAGAPKGSWKWIADTVDKIDFSSQHDSKGVAVLASGERLAFSHIVIATGSSGPLPNRLSASSREQGIAQLQDMQAKVRASHDIVVLGGGPAGVEVAGDIKAAHPDKNVTLVHSRKEGLLNDSFGPKLRQKTKDELEHLGVELVLGERPSISMEQMAQKAEKENKFVFNGGKSTPCDYFIPCIGQTPNSSLIKLLSPSSITTSGHIRVLPTLEVKGLDQDFGTVFALGDVVDRNPVRNGRSAHMQSIVVADNIIRAIKGKKLRNHTPEWFEGAINLTVGLDKKITSATDGNVELTMEIASKDPALNSRQVWRFFSVKPFVDPEELSPKAAR